MSVDDLVLDFKRAERVEDCRTGREAMIRPCFCPGCRTHYTLLLDLRRWPAPSILHRVCERCVLGMMALRVDG